MAADEKECEMSRVIGAYHDGELPPQRRLQVEEHLHTCQECAKELAALRTWSGFWTRAELPKLDPQAKAALSRQVAPQSSGGLLLVRWMTAIAAIICLVALSKVLLQRAVNRNDNPLKPEQSIIHRDSGTTEPVRTHPTP